MSLLQQIAENLGATGATGASWMHTIAIQEGATGPVGGSWIQAWADAVGVTGPIGGSWIQALADHYGVTGGEGDWLIGIEVGTSGGGGEAPVNTVAPAITGTTETGETLSCSDGSWTGTPTIIYTYQWKRNGSPIGGATNSSYVLVSGDVGTSVKCTVTATNDIGATNADSNTVTPTAPPWYPSQLTNATLWFRADSGITLSGSDVTSWTDIISGKVATPYSGSSGVFTYNATDANFNGEPSLQFDKDFSNNISLITPSDIILNNNQIFYWSVYYMNSPQENEQVYTDLQNPQVNAIQFNGGSSGSRNEFNPSGVNNGRMASPYTTNLAVPQIFLGQIDSNALTYKIYDNRTTATTGGLLSTAINNASNFQLQIGNGFGNGPVQYEMDGRIAEIGYAWCNPTGPELTELFNYLTTRYGIVLS